MSNHSTGPGDSYPFTWAVASVLYTQQDNKNENKIYETKLLAGMLSSNTATPIWNFHCKLVTVLCFLSQFKVFDPWTISPDPGFDK